MLAIRKLLKSIGNRPAIFCRANARKRRLAITQCFTWPFERKIWLASGLPTQGAIRPCAARKLISIQGQPITAWITVEMRWTIHLMYWWLQILTPYQGTLMKIPHHGCHFKKQSIKIIITNTRMSTNMSIRAMARMIISPWIKVLASLSWQTLSKLRPNKS